MRGLLKNFIYYTRETIRKHVPIMNGKVKVNLILLYQKINTKSNIKHEMSSRLVKSLGN